MTVGEKNQYEKYSYSFQTITIHFRQILKNLQLRQIHSFHYKYCKFKNSSVLSVQIIYCIFFSFYLSFFSYLIIAKITKCDIRTFQDSLI